MNKEQLIVKNFIIDHPVIFENNQDEERVVALLLDEVNELVAAIHGGVIEEIASELIDVYWFLLSIAFYRGIDMQEWFGIKSVRNLVKRKSSDWQEGNYDELDMKARIDWEAKGGDEAFMEDIRRVS